MKALPQSANLTFEPVELDPGLVGLVEAVGHVMGSLGGDVDLDELVCISGAAFGTYVYDPELNRADEEGRRYSPLGEFFSNYGPWESLSYYTDFDVTEVLDVKNDDFWKLVRFELAEGRPVVSIDLGESLQPVIITGYDDTSGTRTVTVFRGGATELEEVDIRRIALDSGDEASLRNWLVFVRPGESPEWTMSRTRQRISVLSWAVRHAHNRAEFFHETCENYAPGLLGLESFLSFLEDLDLEDLAEASYLHDHLASRRSARRAAARRLEHWGEDLAKAAETDVVKEALKRAAGAYARAASVLDSDDDIADRYESSREAELAAVAALEDALEHLPGEFTPLQS